MITVASYGLQCSRKRAKPLANPHCSAGATTVRRCFTGRDFSEIRRLGLARSTDGVRWTELPAVFSGAQAWDAKAICDPSVVVEGGEIRVWFGGGDAASPDENLHGQIGFGVLRPVNATLAK